MDFRITLDPQLGLSAFDFIVTWKATPECRAVAMARTSSATPVRFDLSLVTGTSVMLVGVANEAAREMLPGLVRRVLENRGIRKVLELTFSDRPDGVQEILVG